MCGKTPWSVTFLRECLSVSRRNNGAVMAQQSRSEDAKIHERIPEYAGEYLMENRLVKPDTLHGILGVDDQPVKIMNVGCH